MLLFNLAMIINYILAIKLILSHEMCIIWSEILLEVYGQVDSRVQKGIRVYVVRYVSKIRLFSTEQ